MTHRFAACFLGLALPMAALAGTQFRSADYPGAANTALYAINNDRHVVGAERDSAGAHHAIIDRGQGLTLLDPDGVIGIAAQSWAFSINGHDDVAGLIVDAAGALHGFLAHADGRVDVVDVPGGSDTQAYGVNDRGDLIGVYNDAAGLAHAFVRRGGRFQNADLAGSLVTTPLSIDNEGRIAGEYEVTPGTTGYGYVQQPGGAFTIYSAPGAPPEQTLFISINDHDAILGAWFDDAGLAHNFIHRLRGDRLFNLPASFAATYTSAQTLNDKGDIVGFYLDARSVAHGFVATHEGETSEERR